MEQPLRPLGSLMQLLEELGHEVTYAYDDLVFVSHNGFMLQFEQKSPTVNLIFNRECPKKEIEAIEESIIPAADKKGLSITRKGWYVLIEQPDENLQIEFFDN